MLHDRLLLMLVGFVAGVINAVAGGGSLVSFPLLMYFGLSPIVANITTSISVLPGTLVATWGYRRYLKRIRKQYFLLIFPAMAGSIAGAWALLRTKDGEFLTIVPWFILFAIILLVSQPWLHKLLFSRQGLAVNFKHHKAFMLVISLIIFMASIYGGYFGSGYGIIILAFLGLTTLRSINQMNALKNVIALFLNIVSCAYFLRHGLVNWEAAIYLSYGNALGGHIGAHYGIRLRKNAVRTLVIIWGIAILLFMI